MLATICRNDCQTYTRLLSIGAVQTCVNIVDVEKCCKMSIQCSISFKILGIDFDTAEKDPSEVYYKAFAPSNYNAWIRYFHSIWLQILAPAKQYVFLCPWLEEHAFRVDKSSTSSPATVQSSSWRSWLRNFEKNWLARKRVLRRGSYNWRRRLSRCERCIFG